MVEVVSKHGGRRSWGAGWEVVVVVVVAIMYAGRQGDCELLRQAGKKVMKQEGNQVNEELIRETDGELIRWTDKQVVGLIDHPASNRWRSCE